MQNTHKLGLRHFSRQGHSKTTSRRNQSRLRTGATALGDAAPALRPNRRAAADGADAAEGDPESAPDGSDQGATPAAAADDRAASAAAVAAGTATATTAAAADDSDQADSDPESDAEPARLYPDGRQPATAAQWKSALAEAVDELVDRKKFKFSQSVREQNLARLSFVLRHVPEAAESVDQLDKLLPVLIRCAQADEPSEQRVAQLALEVIAVLAVAVAGSSTSQSLLTETYRPLRRALRTSPDADTKVALLRALGALAFFCRVPSQAVYTAVLALFASVIRTDGAAVDATDNAEVVATAEEMWTFVITKIGVSRDRVEDAIEALLDQLDSTDPDVQIVAGESIATLYELSYNPNRTETDTADVYDRDFDGSGHVPDDDGSAVADPVRAQADPAVQKLDRTYTQVFPPLTGNQHASLVATVRDLSRISSRHLSAVNKRRLHAVFGDVHNSLTRHPALGPRYRTSLDQETGQERGNKLTVSLGPVDLSIRHWWQLSRLQVVRSVLRGGLGKHYGAATGAVADALQKAPPRARAYAGDVGSDDEDYDENAFAEDDE